MLAVLDETSHEFRGGIAYVIAAAVLVADEDDARKTMTEVVGDTRKRPFHWHREGSTARAAAVEALVRVGAVGHVAVRSPVGRKQQASARDAALRVVVPKLLADGASCLAIESRSERDDRRDRITMISILERSKPSNDFVYEWRAKSDPVLWIADALCGAFREYLLQSPDAKYWDALRAANVVDQPTYIGPKNA